MTSETIEITTKTFKYSYPTCSNEEILYKLEVPVEIPHNGSTRELVQRVINMFHIPVYLEDELNEKLAKFVAEETKSFHDKRDEKLLNQLKNSEINVEGIVRHWEKLFKDNVVEFAEQKGTSDEEVFAAAYHKLVHSPALETILQVENSYAKTVANTLKSRDEDISKITQRQTEEMEECMKHLHSSTTEADINRLAAEHFSQQALVIGRWDSQLDALCHTQRAQHRAWLMSTLDHYQTTPELLTPSNSPIGTFSDCVPPPPAPLTARPRLEESFTIHLGSQLKQTHNIRIVAMDIMDLCTMGDLDNPTETSRRLQSALGLYSSELCGAVVVTEAPPGAPPALLPAARAAPDHHFAHVDRQLGDIWDRVRDPLEERHLRRVAERPQEWARRRAALAPGDVLLTRHSNLPDVHVVFHLLLQDTLRPEDITSRHPAILGLRNVLKAACSNDVTTLTLPLLLRHDLTEETTVAWCVRRAELVLKCAKGFMLEAAAAGGAELRTLQLAAPRSSSPQLFAALQALLPAVFRVSSPLKFKPRADVKQ